MTPDKTLAFLTLQVVPEKFIREAAEIMEPEDKNNSFIYALETGKVFKKNNLSPLYLLDSDTMSIYVTSKERMKKMFH
jgi:hypothetical protein